jgi:hypothetical protein
LAPQCFALMCFALMCSQSGSLIMLARLQRAVGLALDSTMVSDWLPHRLPRFLARRVLTLPPPIFRPMSIWESQPLDLSLDPPSAHRFTGALAPPGAIVRSQVS